MKLDNPELRDSKTQVTMGFLLRVADMLIAKMTEQQKAISELETRRTMSFEGAHDPGRQYRQGDCVQRSGGLFVCLAATDELPGESARWRRIGDAK
ncbi:hypothetical protein [Polaromonas sp. JS666]|uniref:hypothetical protein n=1 Tax=Polaromonas sp. (strain JS666 / ATCC BAA-500) TaxID=296591 RepID=UPI0000463F13|nr:hypothetical protein [Polaromonas sp. JS666]ABE44889.1 hypothetical protein Bpro_2975 [Polaromonas sp. JS666]